MKKFFLFFTLIYTFSLSAQNNFWDVTFHPGDKMGLPSRYACIYSTDYYTIMFRSDIDPIKIMVVNQEIDYTVDQYGDKITDVCIKLYNEDLKLSETYYVSGNVFYNTVVIHNEKMINWIIAGGYVKIIVKADDKDIELKITHLDVDAVKKYLVD